MELLAPKLEVGSFALEERKNMGLSRTIIHTCLEVDGNDMDLLPALLLNGTTVSQGAQTFTMNVTSLPARNGIFRYSNIWFMTFYPVLYGKYAGTELKHEEEDYLIMKESDILAIINNK